MAKFKKGDKVICIKGNSIINKAGAGWSPGYVFIIDNISEIGTGRNCYWPGKKGLGVYEDFLELVNPDWDT